MEEERESEITPERLDQLKDAYQRNGVDQIIIEGLKAFVAVCFGS